MNEEKRVWVVLARDRSVVEVYDDHALAEKRIEEVEAQIGKYTADIAIIPRNCTCENRTFSRQDVKE